MNIVIILSGGLGERFESNLPKQLSKLAGKSIIEYTVDVFQKNNNVDEIIIVSKREYEKDLWFLARDNGWTKLKNIIQDGSERFFSTNSALEILKVYPKNTNILIHDAVRPFVNDKIVNNCLYQLQYFDAIDVVIPSSDTLVEVTEDGIIKNIPQRSSMRRGQTPQAFKLETLLLAYSKAISTKKTKFTCDCSVVHAMLPEVPIKTVLGDERNIKITYPLDLYIAEKIIQLENKEKNIDNKDFSFLKDKVVIVIGGTSGIGLEIHNLVRNHGAIAVSVSRSEGKIDVRDIGTIEKFLLNVSLKYKNIDYIVNTTGLLIKKPIDLLTNKEIVDLININYLGVINVAISSKKYLKKSQGMLLNFTSSSYTRGRSLYSIYSSSKSAVVNLTQALAEEWANESIRVNCINPERTATPMRAKNFGIEPKDTLLDPKEVALVAVSTLKSRYTGLVFDVNKSFNFP